MFASKKTSLNALFVLLLSAAGCGGTDSPNDGTGDENGDGKADVISGDGQWVPTQNVNITLNKGYHPLFDDTSNSCAAAEGDGVRVSNTRDEFTLKVVTTRQELANELGVGGTAKISRPLAVSGELGSDFLNKFKGGTNSINLLLTLEASYDVTNLREVDMRDRGVEILETSAEEFRSKCGSNYVAGVRQGGFFKMLITFTAEESDAFRELKSTLSGSSDIAGAEATLNNLIQLKNTASDAELNVETIRVGLDSNTASSAEIIEQGISNESLGKIAEIEQSLKNSVRRDQCADAGECASDSGGEVSCTPCDTAPGYFNNSRRNSGVLAVSVGQYDQLFSVPSSSKEAFDQITDHWIATENNVRELSLAQEEASDLHAAHIAPFLAAQGPAKAFFNTPGEAKSTLDELTSIGQEWDSKFNAEGTSLVAAIDRHMAECWSEASRDLTKTCTESTQGTTEGLQSELASEVDSFKSGAGLMRMRAVISDSQVNSADKARLACEDLAGQWRLPNESEVEYMNLLMETGIDWGSAEVNEIFTQDTACANSSQDSIYVLNGGTGAIECIDRPVTGIFAGERRVVCVETSGLFER